MLLLRLHPPLLRLPPPLLTALPRAARSSCTMMVSRLCTGHLSRGRTSLGTRSP